MEEKEILVATTYCGDYDEEEFFEHNDDASISFGDWLDFMIQESHDNFIYALKQIDGKVKVNGTLGLWDGQHIISETELDNVKVAFERCVNGCDSYRALVKDGLLLLECIHHDGVNRFSIAKEDGEFTEGELI